MSNLATSPQAKAPIQGPLPPDYQPAPFLASGLRRFFRGFSRVGRAQNRLWAASQAPENTSPRKALAVAVSGLVETVGGSNPLHTELVHNILLFLTWAEMEHGTPGEAASWLAELDRRFADSLERLSLRWGLLQKLKRSHAMADYAIQAQRFLADGHSVTFKGAVLETLRTIHADVPPKQRLEIAGTFHSSLASDAQVAAVMVLWQCPPAFGSQSEANEWGQKLSPESLRFAPLMHADALLAAGRAAEWGRDWATMERHASEALCAVPDHGGALFLQVRALLQQSSSHLPDLVKATMMSDGPAWRRLNLECRLHERMDLPSVKDLLAVVPEVAAANDGLELDLALRLLENALTSPQARHPDHLGEAAELTTELKKHSASFLAKLPFFKCACVRCKESLEFPRELAGQTTTCPHCQKPTRLFAPSDTALLTWAEVNLALKAVQCDRRFKEAFQRLEQADLAAYGPAESIAQVARLLAGSPKTAVEPIVDYPSMAVIAATQHAVFDRPGEHAPSWSELRSSLAEALGDPYVREFPSLVAAVEVLVFAVRLLAEDPAVRDELLQFKLSPAAPPWATWLFGRLVELLCNSSDAAHALRRIPLLGIAEAWFVEVWWHNYGAVDGAEPSAVSEAHQLLDERLTASFGPSVGSLRRVRIEHYRSATPPSDLTPLGNVFAELGELCSRHCELEVKLELGLAQARFSLRTGNSEAAVPKLRKLLEDLDRLSPWGARWWRPVIEYWLGIALAHAGQVEAVDFLNGVLAGPKAQSLSPAMKADAFVALGRLAEWQRDWSGMEARGREAFQVVPDFPSGILLMIRSRLRREDWELPEDLAHFKIPESDEWLRLRMLCDLREHCDLDRGKALISSLSDPSASPDPLDLDLTMQLLERVLTSPAARSSERLRENAELSIKLGGLLGALSSRLPFFKRICAHCGDLFEFSRNLAERTAACSHCSKSFKVRIPRTPAAWVPWAEVNMALKELHYDRRFAEVFRRLEHADLAGFGPAKQLAQVARLLAGSPEAPPGQTDGNSSIAVLATAMHFVLGKSGKLTPSWGELRDKLAAGMKEPLFSEFPSLAAAGEILVFAVRLLADDPAVRDELLRHQPSPATPPWALWLFGRLVEVVCSALDAPETLGRVPLTGIAEAWFLEVWWHCYGLVDGPEPSAVIKAHRLLDERLPALLGPAGDPLRVARRQHYRQSSLPSTWSAPVEAFADLGELAGQHCANEIELELGLAQARSTLQKQDAAGAAAKLRKLLEQLPQLSHWGARWWQPVIEYWLGVALAQAGQTEAVEVLNELLSGPKAAEARTQLALLALQDQDLAAAEWWLGDLGADLPGTCFARALLLARRGQPEPANNQLQSLLARFSGSGSHYLVAARRLMAGLMARAGRTADAVQMHESFLEQHPGDVVATTRLASLRLRLVYASVSSMSSAPWSEIAGLLQTNQFPDPTVRERAARHRLLCRVLGCADANLDALRAETEDLCHGPDTGLAWRQILARRSLEAGRPEDAHALLTGLGAVQHQSSLPTWFLRSCAILKAWRTLKQVAETAGRVSHGSATAAVPANLSACLDDLNQVVSNADDVLVNRWKELLKLGIALASSTPHSVPSLCEALAPWFFAYVPDLWAEDATMRFRAAEQVEKSLGVPSGNGVPVQRRLLGCLTSLAMGKEERFLEQYLGLESDLETLPIDAAQHWQAAARLWLARRDWKRLLVDDLPACLADLSDPGVRFMIGLAYARSAAEDASRGDARTAVQKVRKARSTLEPLLASASEEVPEGKGS